MLIFLISSYLFAPESLAQVPYAERMAGIEEMATVSRGSYRFSDESLGWLGGLHVQTKWQMESGREALSGWNHINSYLTVKSYALFLDYLRAGENACAQVDSNLLDYCTTWIDYFSYSDLRSGYRIHRRISKKLLWRAHMASIYQAIQDNPDVLEDPNTTFEEKLFLKGWIRFVQTMAYIRFPTYEKWIQVLSDRLLPMCAPLGSPNCEIDTLPLATRVLVRKIIAMGKSENQSHFELHDQK